MPKVIQRLRPGAVLGRNLRRDHATESVAQVVLIVKGERVRESPIRKDVSVDKVRRMVRKSILVG